MRKIVLGTACLMAFFYAAIGHAQQYNAVEQTVTTEGSAASQDSRPANSSGGGIAQSEGSRWWRRFQVHGTFSQGFIYGSGNNYLSMNTNDGSAKMDGRLDQCQYCTDG